MIKLIFMYGEDDLDIQDGLNDHIKQTGDKLISFQRNCASVRLYYIFAMETNDDS